MTAAVPDPRFRDQLAEALRDRRDNPAFTGDRERDYSPGAPCMDCGDYPGLRHEASDCPRAVARFVERFVAAEVEARVQAVANQRAAEELDGVADELLGFGDTAPSKAQVHLAAWLQATADNLRAAALASPAPAPDAEEGQHACSRWCAQHTALGGPLDALDAES